MNVIQYVAEEGERWDTISYKAYGTIKEVQRIIDANPNIPITERLIGGTILELPVLEQSNISISSNLLPPWKR